MTLPDVNVILYAFRSEMPQHSVCHAWLHSAVNGTAPYAMSPQVLSSFIRIATNPRAFARPDTLAEATAFADVLLTQPHCQVVHPGLRHWTIFVDLCRKSRATGNLVQDAWFAALAMEHGCEWITEEGDYARFPGLRFRSAADSGCQ